MSVEPIGIFTVLLGILCLFLGTGASVIAFSALTVFGGAAAVLLGGANIQPAHLFLFFLALSTFTFRELSARSIDELKFPHAGFWLAALVLYGAASGYFAPRLLAGTSLIIPLGASEYSPTGGGVPLGPVSSNFTQSIYMCADLLTYLSIVAIGRTEAGLSSIKAGVLAFSAANIFFGLIDLAVSGPIADTIFAFVRNARYTFHDDDVVAGVKRIVGSWPEASAFAGISLGAVGFAGTLWICGRNSLLTFCLFLVTVLLVLRSTSSTGLIALPLAFVLLYFTAIFRCGGSSGTSSSAAIVIFAPPLVLLLGLALVLNEALFRQVYDYVDLLLLSKSGSSSAAERGSWNWMAYQNFLDSYGLGVGLGTARTSSFVLAFLSNVGIPGSLCFILFALSSFGQRRSASRSLRADIQLAARNGCFCLMIGGLVAGPTVDLGLLFFILAGLAGAREEHDFGSSRVMTNRSGDVWKRQPYTRI